MTIPGIDVTTAASIVRSSWRYPGGRKGTGSSTGLVSPPGQAC
jgi:hypothetical protein